MMFRYWLTASILVPAMVLGLAFQPALGAQKGKAPRGGPVADADLDSTQLIVLDPIPFGGPTAPVVREVKVGDIIQIQGTYPIAPPFPERACVKVSNKFLSAVAVTTTSNQVAILGPKPQQGKIGVGYVSAYVRANSPGESTATFTEFFPDGGTKDITVAFKISEREGRDSSGGDRPAGPIEVFAFPYELTSDDKLVDGPTPDAASLPIDRETMLLWVDLEPDSRFAHPTLYVLITGKGIQVVKGNWWPVLNGKSLFRGPNQATVMSPTVLQRIRPQEAERPGTAEVFLYPYELTPRDELKDGPISDRVPFPIRSNTMLVWVDLLPDANFAHPTLYVLISAAGARVEEGQWWPVLNGRALFRGPNQAGVSSPMVLP